MTTAASLLLLAALLAATCVLVRYAINKAQQTITDAINEIPWPTSRDALVLKWAEIREDFAPDEFELLRRIDRELAGAEAAVIRDWQDARAKRRNEPYNWQERGL